MNHIEVHNIATLLEAIKSLSEEFRGHTKWFRGHADASWQLIPSVHRRFDIKGEVDLTVRFRFGAPTRYANCPGSDDLARWLCLMQHFSLPTRLLDWTESPLVAAFFAVAYDPRPGPAAIWFLSPGSLNQLATGKISLATLPGDKVSHLLRPAFVGGESPDEVIAVLGQEVDLRMSVQQGGFTIHGQPAALESHPKAEQFLRKFVIPEEYRETFRKELWLLGIRRSMLFPDIENLAKELSSERPYQRERKNS